MRLPELAQRRARVEAAAHLVRRLLDGAGGLFAGDAVRRGAREMARAGRSTSSAPTCRPRCVDRARAGTYSQFEVQRGLGINQMIKWFEECRRRLARGRGASASRSASRSTISSSRRRIPADSTSSCAATSCSISARRRRRLSFDRLAEAMAEDGWLMLGAGETVIGQTEQARRRHQRARPLPARRRRQPDREAPGRSQDRIRGLDAQRHSSCANRRMDSTSSNGPRRTSTSGSCRSR